MTRTVPEPRSSSCAVPSPSCSCPGPSGAEMGLTITPTKQQRHRLRSPICQTAIMRNDQCLAASMPIAVVSTTATRRIGPLHAGAARAATRACQWYTRGPVKFTSSSSRRSAAAASADATTASSARPGQASKQRLRSTALRASSARGRKLLPVRWREKQRPRSVRADLVQSSA